MAWKRNLSGYVVTTAKITRAGAVEYYGYELGILGVNSNKKFTINRTIEELSSPETLASFDGQTLTLTHPDEGEVDAIEWRDKAIGHIQNVRVEGDYILCDVYIKDALAIKVITDMGIRELSVGYEPAVIVERGSEFYQINIRCNHVAVVAEGRIGSECRLNDKKGGEVKYTIKDILGVLKNKRLKDAEGKNLTEDELIGMIAALESTLADLEGDASKETVTKAREVMDQLAELKMQLESIKRASPGPVDTSPESVDVDSESKIAELKSENAELKAKIAELEAEIEKLKEDKDTETTLADAKERFTKVKFNDVKTARDVRSAVLESTGVFNDTQVKSMSDSEIRAAYAAVQAISKPRSNIGEILLNDATTKKPDLTKQFGGK
jgi:hypothetical protein